MKMKNNDLIFSPALVLKNFIPFSNKVVLLHKYLGKITCVYFNKEQAALLCTGTLILCTVEKQRGWYRFVSLEVNSMVMQCSVQKLSFLHDITRICLQLLPTQVAVLELFDFVWYVYRKIKDLDAFGQQIVLMRLFLLFDLLPEQAKGMYHCALQDPYGEIAQSQEELDGYVRVCWNRFYQEVGT